MKYNRHHLVTASAAALAVIVCLALYGALDGLELKAYDARFRLAERLGLASGRASGQVIVVGIDETSVISKKPLLFIYDDIGKFLQRMNEHGARAVGLDIILVHKQSDKLRVAAEAFAAGDPQTKKKYGEFMGQIGERLDRSVLGPIMDASANMQIVQVVHGDLVPFYYGVSPLIKNMTIADASLTDGDLREGDGVIRKQRLQGTEKKAFASVLYALAAGREYPGSEVSLNYFLTGSIPFYFFDDVMEGRIDGNKFKGKSVILGYMSSYEDVHATPLGRDIRPSSLSKKSGRPDRSGGGRMPGPFIHGIITETMLTGTQLKEAPPYWNVVVLVVMAGIALASASLLRPAWAAAASAAAIAVFFAVNLALFASGSYLRLIPQIIAPPVVLMLVYPYRYFVEERTRRKVQKVFGYYIDKDVLDRFLETDSEALLGGESRNICIFFLDVRNFTMLSTKRRADEMVKFLNFFFGAVTEIIQKHRGFVNKFIGDGILAFFMTGEDPVTDAVGAAGDILKETKRLNEEKRFHEFIGDWEVGVGIGIHYGEVILGNIGSERKMDFTIIGEHVNIASRVEGLTKDVGSALLVSGAARDVAGNTFRYRHIGERSVKGVQQPVPLYTVEEI